MGLATIIIFVAVIHRYLSGMPIPGLQDWLLTLNFSWAQEATIYLFVWMAKFGAAYGVRTGIHVGVDLFINRMKDKTRAKFVLFGLLAGAVFTGTVAALGAHFVWANGAHYAFFDALGLDTTGMTAGPTTPDLEWQTWIIYSAIPLGSSLMCFRFLQVAWHFHRTGDLPHHDHGHVEGIDEVDAARRQPGEDMNGLIIFGLLILLMATGHADLDRARPDRADLHLRLHQRAAAVGRAQALHRSRELRDHGDPVLHPRRQLPDPRRRGEADDQLRQLAGRPLVRRPRPGGGAGVRAVRRALRLVAGVRRRDRLDPDAGDGQGGLSAALRRRRHHHLGRARHPDPAVDRDGDVLGLDQHLARRDVHRRRHSRHRPGDDARRHDLVSRAQEQLPAPAARQLGRALGGVSQVGLGAAPDRRRHGRDLQRPVHADRSGGDGRGLRLLHRRLRLQGPDAARRAARAPAVAPT